MNSDLSRRQFLESAVLTAGVLAVGGTALGQQAGAAANPAGATPVASAAKRTASDLVPLGNTGLKVSRLGLGLGSGNGVVQIAQGQQGLNTLIKHAFDKGITTFDTAQAYRTFGMVGAAIKGLPRDKIFIQSKIGQPNDILNVIDNHRKTFGTDYVDSMLIHIQYRANWTETWKKAMEDFNTALERKWILSKGVSCHSLPALRASIASDWTQVHLVRVNPQGVHIDSEAESSWARGPNDVNPLVAELKKMHEKKRGVIGMKIYGNGDFRDEADRAKSVRYAMSLREIDSVVIGFADTAQLDEGIKLMNTILSEAA